jgi:lipopolysaccharide/colanic/teichoic acid biosynthesis glycosyltransferase
MREQTGSITNREMRAAPVRAQRPSAFARKPLVSNAVNVGEIIAYTPSLRVDANVAVGGWSKRAFDIAASSAALILLAPLLLVIAAAVRLDSPGQSIFRQERGGFRGKTFRIWKFRTMTVTENRGIIQACRNDARFTELGAFLRRSSLDELPQLLNVLMGDMSIIGPRPHALEHDAQFETVEPRYGLRFRARPGVTGLAQVSGCRGPTETDEKIRARTAYDIDYVQNWSWKRDAVILLRTASLLWKDHPGAL